MAYNTGNPLGSSSPKDFSDNAHNLDLAMGSTEKSFLDRFGRPRVTYQAFHEMAVDAITRVDATVDAAQDQVNDARDTGISSINATRDAANAEMLQTAAELGGDLNNKRYASYAAMIADPQTRDAVVAVVDSDQDNTRNGWYYWSQSSGAWVRFADQPAFSSVLLSKVPGVSNISAGMIPLIINEAGKVILWLENGRVNGAGLSQTVAASVQGLIKTGNFSASMLPLTVTEGGQVVSWLKDGRFNAAGLNLTISEAVQAALATYQVPPTKYTDSSKLWTYRAQVANAQNATGFARVFYTGDSWSHQVREIPQPLAEALYGSYGQSGTGWISVYADEGGPTAVGSQLLNGAKLIKSAEWTLIDMSPTESDSLDGHAASATGTTGRIDITGLKTQALTWYYKDTAGTFRYSVDGGTPVVVTGGNTGLRKSFQITGLADVNHNIVFDLVGNTGTVVMYGGMAARTASGIELSKSGNGGSTTVQWAAIAPFVQAYAAELKPDLVIIVLGTNDINQGITKATFKSSLQTLVNAYRAGSPNCGVLLMTPTRAQSSLDLGLIAQYAEAMSEISLATPGVEFLNLNAFMPPRITSDVYGLWKDALHLSVAGGRFVTALLMKYFLRVN